jgi:hypothetical protein
MHLTPFICLRSRSQGPGSRVANPKAPWHQVVSSHSTPLFRRKLIHLSYSALLSCAHDGIRTHTLSQARKRASLPGAEVPQPEDFRRTGPVPVHPQPSWHATLYVFGPLCPLMLREHLCVRASAPGCYPQTARLLRPRSLSDHSHGVGVQGPEPYLPRPKRGALTLTRYSVGARSPFSGTSVHGYAVVATLLRSILNAHLQALRFRSTPCGVPAVGMTGFEPATTRPPAECAAKLRHIPLHQEHGWCPYSANHLFALRNFPFSQKPHGTALRPVTTTVQQPPASGKTVCRCRASRNRTEPA